MIEMVDVTIKQHRPKNDAHAREICKKVQRYTILDPWNYIINLSGHGNVNVNR